MAAQKKEKITNISASKRLSDFIRKAVSPYHTVEESRKLLEAAGFEEVSLDKEWKIKPNGKYYVLPFKTSLFAFTVPGTDNTSGSKKNGTASKTAGIHIAAAHTDFPCLHIKPVAEYEGRGYLRVNTEVYGGPILNTWLDRPLSIAGRVLLKSDDIYAPREVMVDFKRPLLTIPNLAIHYNREVNDGVKLTKQNDMLPLLGMLNDKLNKQSYFVDMLAKEIKEKKEDILDFDLYVYNAEEPAFIGLDKEMLSAPRLDNITSCLALVEGLINADGPDASLGFASAKKAAEKAVGKKVKTSSFDKRDGINLIALFDNEEIGSETKQGADSELLRLILRKIYKSSAGFKNGDTDEIALDTDLRKGFLLSVDVAHALHPAKGDKYDPVNNMRMGEGVTLKLSANQRYTYDGVAVASLQQLCDKYGVKYKKFVNNSDMPGGGTLGPIISSHLPMYTVDIGVPILAMHSARELMGASDQDELVKLLTAFFL
ncbi:MAG: M18 family aminopeptidase [Lachnospiraceae bacterium]|nr:M18 family aminopeptidase [Lachnospiraceae bacterium]